MNITARGFVLAVLCTSGFAWAQTSPYAGQEQRAIKSMSEQEVAGLLTGAGAGFARAAELNGYPGPMHVLELADGLALNAEQRAATQSLMTQHKARARTLGERLVDAERDLDTLFAQRVADTSAVDAATRRVGLLQADLRAEHLKTHVAQTALLSGDQVRMYSVLRGYTGAGALETKNAPAGGQHQSRSH
ncbi:MAG: periplasmic heavy metal sensor [Candidatus Binatota bacterium]|nr:periplasmic heavy metal sensor [Candidatus Binatota bacterium]